MRIALAQLISSANPADNLAMIRRLAADARRQDAELVVFPEAAMCAFGNPVADVAQPLDGPWAEGMREISRELDITIVAGMFTPGTDGKVRNTLLATGPTVETHYDKIHLFDAFGFSESDAVDPGGKVATFNLNGTTVGLSTCYDIRFPSLFIANAEAGAVVNIVCASWGAGPGKREQWDLLARARALDATCFVLACGQGDPATTGVAATGSAPTGIGRSAIVSPLGEVLQRLDGKEGLLVADLDLTTVAEARKMLPVLDNRRVIKNGTAVSSLRVG